jgi:hypothetical protein
MKWKWSNAWYPVLFLIYISVELERWYVIVWLLISVQLLIFLQNIIIYNFLLCFFFTALYAFSGKFFPLFQFFFQKHFPPFAKAKPENLNSSSSPLRKNKVQIFILHIIWICIPKPGTEVMFYYQLTLVEDWFETPCRGSPKPCIIIKHNNSSQIIQVHYFGAISLFNQIYLYFKLGTKINLLFIYFPVHKIKPN